MQPVIGIDASRAVSTAPTGTEGYSYHLIRALLAQLRPAYDVRLYLREAPPPGAFTGADLRVIPFPKLWTHLRLSWEMTWRTPDVLFVPAHVLPPVRPKRTLVTIHDLGFRHFPQAHPWQQRLYLNLSTRWNARVATKILADSIATRDAICEAYHIPAEKITVVYPGYDATLHPPRDPGNLQHVQEKYGIRAPYVLTLGRIQPRKNLVRLVQAFARIAKQHPELMLVLAGPGGWLQEPIFAQAKALGIEERVRFPGYIAETDKAALISGAIIFAFPSLYEGFGFPVLEAQACCVPVLTSTTSSLPEVAGRGAFLVDPIDEAAIAEGLQQLLESASLRDYLIQKGTENLQRFSWSSAAQHVAELIHTTLA
ncbi:MAG: glycosyltransferase family 4 protein [Anaerolineae bacterium]|nr:glycosyltransferase family 4 protein [Anaerolineae bacterium]